MKVLQTIEVFERVGLSMSSTNRHSIAYKTLFFKKWNVACPHGVSIYRSERWCSFSSQK